MTDGTVYNNQSTLIMRDNRVKEKGPMEKHFQKVYNGNYWIRKGAEDTVASVTDKAVKRRLKFIKKTIKIRIAKYDPLDYRTAYRRILEKLQPNDFVTLREIPSDVQPEPYLDELVKNHLIETAYYELEERYIRHRLMAKLGLSEVNDIRLMEIVDFITAEIERDNFKRLKYYKEEAKFKTFFSTVVSSLLMDFWRNKYRDANHATKYESDFEDYVNPPIANPLERLLDIENQELMQTAKEILPKVLAGLDQQERLVIKLKYNKGMNTSAIARSIGFTRYKTEQLIRKTEYKLSAEIHSNLGLNKRGGQDGTPKN